MVPDRKHVSFMYSYPNYIPLSASAVERIVKAVEPFEYDRVYGAFWDMVIERDGKAAVRAVSGAVSAGDPGRNEMSECDLDTSVPDWVIEHPETLAVFQELGIDYCCGGKSLAYACRQQGLDAQAVLAKLLRCLDARRQDDCRRGLPPTRRPGTGSAEHGEA